MPRAFVIRSFGIKKDSGGAPIDFDAVHAQLIQPALVRCGLNGGTTAEIVDAGNIREDMFALILEADVVVCDITVHNANVFYELGVRHALRKKHTVLVKGDPSADVTPFDLSTDRYLKYPVAAPARALDALVASIQAGLNGQRETDSPIFLMLPTLVEADPSDIAAVPLDLIQEVQRAEASVDKGWLRVIADDVRGERFETDALKVVARAQWSLKDYDGARAAWEAVLAVRARDREASLALANLYERLYRATSRPALLESSNQAIRAVLDDGAAAPEDRAEALTLHGRNLKTLWRLGFEELPALDERRSKALDARLMQSYEAYRSAFSGDLNNFYAGIAAFQAGFILQTLSGSPAWRNLFGRDAVKATRYREDLQHQLAALEQVVAMSVARAKEQEPPDKRLWADISEGDLIFLTEPEQALRADPGLVVETYRAAIPANKRFAWDATRGQLELFATLGIRAEVAQAVIGALDPGPAEQGKRARHLVVFSGHTIDRPGAAAPRFPASAETQARALIADHLRRLRSADEEMVVLASAAPGADILLHEVCAEEKLEHWLCLPLAAEVVAREVFALDDRWRARFFAVVKALATKTLQLGDDLQGPRWLRARGVDPWERGNRWVLQLASTWGAERVTLLALWDGDEAPGATGGTAQMVRLARRTGTIAVDVIDSRQLLA
jgi:hypothetical protein